MGFQMIFKALDLYYACFVDSTGGSTGLKGSDEVQLAILEVFKFF